MTLTKEDVTALTKHFRPNEHEFRNNYAYITESAVGNRLDEVDPAWSWEIINEWTRDNQAICAGRLTICGVSRDGVGMQPLTIVSSKDGKVLEGTEPEKSAATDALKRAARLFGIGRYLLDTPGWVKTVDDVAKWLKPSNGNHAPPPTERPTVPPSQNGTHGDNGKTIDFPGKPATPKNAAPAPVVKGDTKIEALKGVIAEEYIGKGNKKAVRFVTSTGSYSYTRQPFRDAGLDTEQWTKAGNSYTFDGPFNVISVWHQPEDPKAQGYWKIDRLEPIDQPLERFPAPEGAKDIPF